ncbi:serine protease grass-like [Ixodes scapularis]
MVGLYTPDDTFHCGGVLIDAQYVLTAAHCLRYRNASFLTARLGSTNKTKLADCPNETNQQDFAERSNDIESKAVGGAQVICVEIAQVCIPRQKNCSFFMEDIAMLKLKTPVTFTEHIQPICLPDNCVEPSLNVATYIAGWGQVEKIDIFDYTGYDDDEEDEEGENGEDGSSQNEETEEPTSEVWISVQTVSTWTLRERKITLINSTTCQKQLNRSVPYHTMCSTGGTCAGDSGGPLMYEINGTWFLVGIHSAGSPDCYEPQMPGRHIKVSYYIARLILAFMERSNHDNGRTDDVCATEDSRIRCVTEFFASYNVSLEYKSDIE